MAMQEASPAPAPSAQDVGNAFVEQYYHILHQSPNLVHRFYQDSSSLSRPNSSGEMTTVTTMQAINEKILSLNYEDYTAEIKTADAQDSYEEGVMVLVTGCLTGKDDIERKFTQTFFLAPQDKGYYVLNDVFRYVEENEALHINPVLVNAINDNIESDAVAEPELVNTPDHCTADPATDPEGGDLNDGAEILDPLENEEEGSVIEEEVVEPSMETLHVLTTENEVVAGGASAPAVQDDAPKKSYASILKVMKGNASSGIANVTARPVRSTSSKYDQQLPQFAKPAPPSEAPIPSNDSAPEGSNALEEVEGHSIYVRNLPFNATVEQLEAVFKKFGPIKHDGIQVRSSKGFCFGFVEFEALSSMQSALEASPIKIGDRPAVVEEKRTTTRVGGSGRGRYPPGRGGFRSESFKGRGKFGGGRGFGRNEFKNQGEFSGRPRGSGGHNGESAPRINQNGGGRGGRQGGVTRNSTPSAAD